MKLFTLLAALNCAALTSRAQVTLTPTSVSLPTGHSAIIGLAEVYGAISVLTSDEMWWQNPDSAYSEDNWIKWGSAAPAGFRLFTRSLTIPVPLDSNKLLFTTVYAGNFSVLEYRVNPVGSTQVIDLGSAAVENPAFPSGLAASPSGMVYVAWANGIKSYTHYVLTNSFNAPAELAFSSQGPLLSYGVDDILYALDRDNNRVLRFSADGDYLSSYSVASNSQAFGVSASGFLFVATNSSASVREGYIYDANTGTVIGTFDLPEDHDESVFGNAAITLIGDQMFVVNVNGSQLHSFDISGLSAVPEPSTYAAILGVSALGFVIWRRRYAVKRKAA